MPSKKKPISLEAASLQSIGRHIFLPSITKAVKNILIRYLFEYFGDKELKTEKQNLYRIVVEEHELNQSWWNEYENVGNCKINKNKSTSFKTQSMQTIEDNVFQLQKFFFVETAHYFHSFIAIECLVINCEFFLSMIFPFFHDTFLILNNLYLIFIDCFIEPNERNRQRRKVRNFICNAWQFCKVFR